MQSTRENKSLDTQDQPTKASSVNSQNKKPHTSTNALNPSGETSPNALKHKHYPRTIHTLFPAFTCTLRTVSQSLRSRHLLMFHHTGTYTTISETSHIPLSAPSSTSNPTTTPHPPKELRVMPLKRRNCFTGAGFCIACNQQFTFGSRVTPSIL